MCRRADKLPPSTLPSIMHRAFCNWQMFVMQQVQSQHLQRRYQERLKAKVFQCWAAAPARTRQLNRACAAFRNVGRRLQQTWVLCALQGAVLQSQVTAHMTVWKFKGVLRQWHVAAKQSARHRRMLQCRWQHRSKHMLRRCLAGWCLHAQRQHRQHVHMQVHNLKVGQKGSSHKHAGVGCWKPRHVATSIMLLAVYSYSGGMSESPG